VFLQERREAGGVPRDFKNLCGMEDGERGRGVTGGRDFSRARLQRPAGGLSPALRHKLAFAAQSLTSARRLKLKSRKSRTTRA